MPASARKRWRASAMRSGVDSWAVTGRGEAPPNSRPPFGFGGQSRNAFLRPLDTVRSHLGAGDFLDLAGRAGSVVDPDALAEPQIDDVLLASDLLRGGGLHQCEQSEPAHQQDRQ